jgi:hypothetical protein
MAAVRGRVLRFHVSERALTKTAVLHQPVAEGSQMRPGVVPRLGARPLTLSIEQGLNGFSREASRLSLAGRSPPMAFDGVAHGSQAHAEQLRRCTRRQGVQLDRERPTGLTGRALPGKPFIRLIHTLAEAVRFAFFRLL